MKAELNDFNSSDPNFWARATEYYSEWAREIMHKYDIDASKFLLGYVLSIIIGDDPNCFGIPCVSFDTKNAELMKMYLTTRLRWEISFPETPSHIKSRLEEFLQQAAATNWNEEAEFVKIREQWTTEVKEFVEQETTQSPYYTEAVEYSLEKSSILSTEYQEFLFGNTY